MSSIDAAFRSSVRTSSPRHATGYSARTRSLFGGLLTILGLASGLIVAQVASATLGGATRDAGPPTPVDPGPSAAAPPLTDHDIVQKSVRGRLDVPLPVDLAPLDGASEIDANDVVLVTYATAGNLPLRSMPYEEFATDPQQMLDRLPTLDTLQEQMPTRVFFEDIDRQKQHIQALDEEAEITLEGFTAFEADRQHRAFVPTDGPLERIDPQMFIVHWTGGGYDDVEHFLRVMGRLRVQFFIDRDARVYDLFSADDERPSHALGANDFSQGVEIESGHFDEVHSPLFGYTAEQITQTVYLAVDFLRRNGLPVDRTTIVGHYAADLIFSNPYYDPHKGTFSQGRIRKFDPPEELMRVIVNKAQALDQVLDQVESAPNRQEPIDARSQPSPGNPGGLDPTDVRRRINAEVQPIPLHADERRTDRGTADHAPNRRR